MKLFFKLNSAQHDEWRFPSGPIMARDCMQAWIPLYQQKLSNYMLQQGNQIFFKAKTNMRELSFSVIPKLINIESISPAKHVSRQGKYLSTIKHKKKA